MTVKHSESYSPFHSVHADGKCTCEGKNHETCPHHQHQFPKGLSYDIIEFVKTEMIALVHGSTIDLEIFKNGNWRFVTNNTTTGSPGITIITVHPFCHEGVFTLKFTNNRKDFELADPQFPQTAVDCIRNILQNQKGIARGIPKK